jgi:uncharacterized membrane protein
MVELFNQIGAFFAAQPIGWGTIGLLVIGYFFVTRILKLIFFCVFLVAIAAGWLYLTHAFDTPPHDKSSKTVIEKKH